jgi:Rod binding domain-containing protein
MELSPLNSHRIDASNMSLERLAANKSVPESEKIKQASSAFEAVMLRQILTESMQPVFPSKFVGNSTSDAIYRDEMVNQLAENISKSGSFGLGKSLAAELQRQSHATAADQPPGAAELSGAQKAGHHPAGTSGKHGKL